MTHDPVCCSPSDSLQRAAHLMRSHNVGALPVISDGKRLLGIITDRDIVVRADAESRPMGTAVESAMSRNAVFCYANDVIDRALELMTIGRVRRLPVIDADGAVIGILSKVDVARRLPPAEVRRILARIGGPSRARKTLSMAGMALLAIGALGAGAAAMYVLDPSKGRGRRARLKDKIAHICREAVEKTESARNEVVNRALGMVAEARARVQSRPVEDVVLAERVRARLGRFASHPHEVAVAAEDGVVTLTGHIPRVEIRSVLHATQQIPGVEAVVNHLEATAAV